MKKKLIALTVIMMLAAGSSAVFAQTRGTATDAQEMMKKAVVYLQETGKEKALAEFNDPKGKFIYRDIYIYASDEYGLTLAHPITPVLVGKNMMNLKDADGKMFIKEALDIVKEKGSAVVAYRWMHPQTKKVEMKGTYVTRVNGVILFCGYYK
jgi:hypothetical protein